MGAEFPKSAEQQPERRHATVMFADISGFTALSEQLDPEDVTSVMNGCFRRLESVVFAHGGVVDEYLGDCIKAVFGFSPATTNPTAHAVQAAIEIREALYQYNRDAELASPLDIHIGINTGYVIGVVMGDPRNGDFSVMGDTVRFATHLEDISDRGEIFVGPETFAATSAEFEYEALPPIELPAHAAPIAAYKLIAPRPVRRVVRDSERRQATVIFADVTGLEALSAAIEPMALAHIMNELFADLADAIAAYGGVVDKFLGEGIMALFGVPNAIENAPRQAVNAAIDMRRRVIAFTATHAVPVELNVHIGVNSGLVIAGDIGGRVKHDFSVMGDAVNLAARLKEISPPGAVYVGPQTQRHTSGDFEYRPLEPLRLKGKTEQVQAFELRSVATQVYRASDVRADRMVFSPMVGRDAELAAFRRALDQLAQGGGGIVSLIGEAGLGKSRLLSETIRAAEALDINLYLGRSLSIGRGQSFHPFIDLLRHWSGIGDESGEERGLARLEAAVRAVLGEQADEVFPFVARLMGLRPTGVHADRLAGIEGEALEKLILRSMRALFHAIGRQRPTALVFEDLHWADQSSLLLLETILPLCTEVPLLFVHVCRPLFEDTSDRIVRLAGERFAARHLELRLEKLDESQSGALIRNLLNIDDLPREVRDLIASKAEGNPFYIEEVVRSLIDEDAIEYVDGHFRVTDKIHQAVIPATIHDVVMARVDRLDESARSLLQTASVIGRHFYYQIISHLIARERALDADLEVLKEKQLIQERRAHWEVAVGDRTLADEIEYMFKHALAQEAVYQSVLLKTRRELHHRVAEAIESIFATRLPEFYATLAYHYTRAERLEPAEDYLCKAGVGAMQSAAFSEGLQLFRDAAAIYDRLHGAANGDKAHRVFLEEHIGVALLNTGQHTESIDHFDHALELLGERVARGAVAQTVRWAIDMAAVWFRMYVHEGSRGEVPNLDREREIFKLYFERGHALVTSDPRRLFLQMATPMRRFHRVDPRLLEQGCSMYVECATIFAYSGLSFSMSERALGVAETLLEGRGIRDVFAFRSMRFTHHYLRGNWNAAPLVEDELIEQALRQGMVWSVTLYVGIEMDRQLRRGNFAAARVLLRRLADIKDTYGYAYAGSNHNGMLAILLLEERQLEEALRLSEAHHVASEEGTLKLMTLGMIAKARVLLGDRAGAADALRRADEVAQREGVVSPWHQSIHHVAQLLYDVTALEAAAARGSRPAWPMRFNALRSSRRAIGTARKVAKERIETYNLSARLWWALGKRGRALRWWTRTIAEAQRMGARPELARTYLDIGQRLGGATLDGVDAVTYRQMAHDLFTDLGLEWDLRQLTAPEVPPIAEAEDAAVA